MVYGVLRGAGMGQQRKNKEDVETRAHFSKGNQGSCLAAGPPRGQSPKCKLLELKRVLRGKGAGGSDCTLALG